MHRFMQDLQVYYTCNQVSLAQSYVYSLHLADMVRHWRGTLKRREGAARARGSFEDAFSLWCLRTWLKKVS